MNIALVLAAGTGSRMGTSIPKQFLMVNNKPLLSYTLETFNKNKQINYIVLVTSKEYFDFVNVLIKDFKLDKVRYIVEGGSTRQESVYHGLEKIKEVGASLTDNILIHDSARALVSNKIIDDNITECDKYDAVETVIPTTDTIIKSLDKETIYEVENRDEQFIVQTPQTFKLGIIKYAHELAIKDGFSETTDDAKLVLKYGHDVHLVKGDKLNFKVTTPDDLKILEALLNK